MTPSKAERLRTSLTLQQIELERQFMNDAPLTYCEKKAQTELDALKAENERLKHEHQYWQEAHSELRTRAEQAEARVQVLTDGLHAAVRELEQVNSIKDGQPLVSHNLLCNLRELLAEGQALTAPVEP